MSERVSTTVRDCVAVVQIDNPPVNALSAGVPDALAAAIDRAEADAQVRAIVVIGAGRTFIAGADINELDRAAWDPTASLPDMHAVLQRIEDSSKPVVMAVHGTALGGGLEVLLADAQLLARHRGDALHPGCLCDFDVRRHGAVSRSRCGCDDSTSLRRCQILK